ncbi:MAG: hypothetical protein Q8L81_10360 [Bacteroidota bacterium]|nr:hypothetical protein [Bacteroidota bacterium]
MKKLLFLIYFMALVSILQSQVETRNSRAYANILQIPGAFIQSEDDKYTGSSGWVSGFSNYENKAIIELGLDEDKHFKYATSFKICATFDIALTDVTTTVVTTYTNVQLDIDYDPLEATRYKDKSQIVFPDFYKVRVYNVRFRTCTVGTGCSTCLTPFASADVYLQAEIATNRIYDFGFSSVLAGGELTDSLTTTQQLKISWGYVSGATEYELEYTYVDNYAMPSVTTTPISSSVLTYDLEHDATRIITNFNHYYIPLTYERGYIIYRLRPIGTNTVLERIEGDWYGAPVSGTIAATSFTKALTTSFSSDLKNWEGVKTFAEHGKTGVGVSFNDALGFKRQSLARINTDAKTISQSTLYDFFGRPAINLLPAPVSGLNLDYRLNLNMIIPSGTTSVVFDKNVFDNYTANTNVCTTLSFTLDPANSVGAGNYYSPSNANKEGYQGYVPNAKGLPYTQVKYKPDALGRITRQTMPGGLHTIGSDKDIRYFYTQPMQVELDRLFGSEAGRSKYHFKNITIDPNGQTSANYKDRFGRTIATSLIGLNPLNVDILTNNVTTTLLTEYLHLAPTNDPDPVDRCKEVNTTFFVSSASTEGYVYHTTLGSFASTCNISTCYDCVYDVELTIKDDCQNDVLVYSQSIGKQPPYAAGACTASPTSTLILGTSISTPVSIVFPTAGVYTVYKKICVSSAPLDDYTADFISNGCNDKKCSLLDSILSETDFTGCGTPTDCATCMASVEAYTAATSSSVQPGPGDPPGVFNNPVYTPSMTPQQYSQALENCDMLCPPKGLCQKYTKLLLADFYPNSGQYAQTVSTNTLLWAYSIFNSANSLTTSPTFSTPISTYSNAGGTADLVQLTNSPTSTVAPTGLTASQYDYYYKKSWAKSFLDIHPEACKLYFYCNIIGSSTEYDDDMNYITHFDTACTAGFLRPINAIYSSYSGTPCASYTTNPDPVQSLITLPTFSTAIINFKNEITQNFNGSGLDIYQYTVLQSVPTASSATITTGDYVGDDACYADIDWIRFRNFYQVKKYALYQNLYTLYAANPSAFGYTLAPACGYAPAGFTSHFPNWMDSLNAVFSATPSIASSVTLALNTPTSVSTNSTVAASYTASMNTFSSNLISNTNSSLTSQCTTACESYTNNWFNILNTACPIFSGTTTLVQNNIIAGLVGVCMTGCDYTTNLLGASTSSPGAFYTIPTTTVTVNSFQGVLNHYLGLNACNAVVLSQPVAYPTQTVQNGNSMTSCKCDQLLQVEADFLAMQTASTLPAGISSAWQLFRKQNGYDLFDYNILTCLCNSATSNTWTSGHLWVSSELAALAQNTFEVNPRLECTSCLSCTNVVTAINSLTLPVGSYSNVIEAITQDSTNQIFAIASLNNTFGVHPFQDYLDLYADCNTFTTSSAYTFSNTITVQAIDLFKYLDQLVSTNLLSNGPRPVKMCTDSKFLLSSLYSGPLPSITAYTYNISTPTLSYITFSISSSPTVNIAVITLSVPGTYTGTWSNLSYLNNFVAYCPTPSAGVNYMFQVNAVTDNLSVITLTGNVVNMAYPICNLSSDVNPVPTLCPYEIVPKDPCVVNLINGALTQAALLAQQAMDGAILTFQNDYMDECYNSINETFTREYNGADEYNFTLYYYDEGGNLQRTVAPNGSDPGILTSVVAPLSPTATLYPAYSSSTAVDLNYVTDNKFHSFNIPLQGSSVDDGQTFYVYDAVGRLVASQNAKQFAASTASNNIYSYTIYDKIGRIEQVGVVTLTASLTGPVNYATFNSMMSLLTPSVKTQVTTMNYDTPVTTATVLAAFTNSLQSNLRNRVAYVTYEDVLDASVSTYDHATYYSYDDHGNVHELIQHIKDLDVFGQGFRKVIYDYELVSGNMVKATFQPEQTDQLIHKYYYDVDNRLHEVFTSKDDMNYDRDAKYFYYEHGPLARVERADKKVQGSDHFYTIHGWVKGINGDALNPIGDPGKDATSGTAYLSSYADIHQFIANDAAAYSLNYYNTTTNTDYAAIKTYTTTDISPTMNLSNLYTNTAPFYLDDLGAGDGANLFNGNIGSMVTSFIDKDPSNAITNNTPFPQIAGFRYDQLHRITKMKTFRVFGANTWTAPTSGNYDDSYKMNFTYDNNGNILTLLRNGPTSTLNPGSPTAMDNLSYTYFKTVANGGVTLNYNSNKLACLNDAVTASNYNVDVDDYVYCSEHNARYYYDEIGNLITDNGEYIATIDWTVDRKLKRITRDPAAMITASVTLPDIEYEYNAQRQRVAKIVKPRAGATRTLTPVNDWLFTYYSYDASGNVLAVYDRNSVLVSGSTYRDILTLSEQDIYGSNRLALTRPTNTLSTWLYTYSLSSVGCGGIGIGSGCRTVLTPPADTYSPPASGYITDRHLGFKEFELTNHLGNINAVVSDRKVQANFNSTACATYFDFNSTVPGAMLAQNMTLGITSGSLQCDIWNGWGISGLDARVGYNVPAATSFLIEYDFNPGTLTLGDGFYIIPYDHDGSFYMGPYYCDGSFVPPAAHYTFTYTPSVTGATVSTYLAFNTNSSSTHTFSIDNLSMCPLNALPTVASYSPDILSETDYYAFGMDMPGRDWHVSNYRYSMNGQEKDDEIFSGAMSAEFWEYDSRIGRRWNLDPVIHEYESPYACFHNNPILVSDINGDDGEPANPNGTKGGPKEGETCSNPVHPDGTQESPERFHDGSWGVEGGTLNEIVVSPSNQNQSPQRKEFEKWDHSDPNLDFSLANAVNHGGTATAENLGQVLGASLMRKDICYITGDLLNKVKNDESWIKANQAIYDRINSDPRYGSENFSLNGLTSAEFGGSDQLSASTDPLTWSLRHANVKYWAEIKKDGTVILEYRLADRLDLSPHGAVDDAYDMVSYALGLIWHDGLGGHKNMATRAIWFNVCNMLKGRNSKPKQGEMKAATN